MNKKRIQNYYDNLIKKGKLLPDLQQICMIAQYDILLNNITENFIKKKSFFDFFYNVKPIKGLYIYGNVGTGKTIIMDIFFSFLPGLGKKKVIFHDFMNEIYMSINRYKFLQKKNFFTAFLKEFTKKTYIFCFDEFAINDIATGILILRLFEELFNNRIVIVITSNVSPDDLYKNGINREILFPLIRILKKNLSIFNVDNIVDYRLKKTGNHLLYLSSKEGSDNFNKKWKNCTNEKFQTTELQIKGNTKIILNTSKTIVRVNFFDLCCNPLSSSDYDKLVSFYKTFFIENVPILDDSLKDAVKRFILLVDILYKSQIRLFILAHTNLKNLYQGNLKTVEAFEFKRTVSRLFEMQSDEYLKNWITKHFSKK